MTEQKAAGAALQSASDPEARRRAAALLGSVTSERKRITSAQNGRMSRLGGRPRLPLSAFACTCGGEGLEHKSTCPRGQAIRRRQKRGQPLE
jgi:hypothetical protein